MFNKLCTEQHIIHQAHTYIYIYLLKIVNTKTEKCLPTFYATKNKLL